MQSSDEKQLLQQILQDPQTGLAQLLDRYSNTLYGVVRHVLPDARDAEECLSDVLVQCWQQAERLLERDGNLRAWLIVTARNKALDRYRRLRRTRTEPLPEDFALLAQELTESHPSEAEEIIAELVDALPPPDREIFMCRYYGLQSSREIGAALQMEVHTVNVRLSRGRKRLREQFVNAFGKEYRHERSV